MKINAFAWALASVTAITDSVLVLIYDPLVRESCFLYKANAEWIHKSQLLRHCQTPRSWEYTLVVMNWTLEGRYDHFLVAPEGSVYVKLFEEKERDH